MSAKRKATDSPGTSSKRACKVLTLAKKVQVIDAVNSVLVMWNLHKSLGVAAPRLLTFYNKMAILEAYTNGTKSNTKYLQPRHCMYPEIDAKVWDFYCDARSKNMPINSGLLKAETLAIAKEKNLTDFTASNGWLESFSSRHQLRFATLHGESASVDLNVCNQWRSQLPRLYEGYASKDI